MTHDFRIRPISATFHRATNRVQGTAPVSGDLSVTVGRPSLATASIPKMCSFTPDAARLGRLQRRHDRLRPGLRRDRRRRLRSSSGTRRAATSSGCSCARRMSRRSLASRRCDGYLDAGTSASLALRSSGGQVRGTSKVTASALTGAFQGAFKNDGVAVNDVRGEPHPRTIGRARAAIASASSRSRSRRRPSTAPAIRTCRYGLALIRAGGPSRTRGHHRRHGRDRHASTSESGLELGDVVVAHLREPAAATARS